MSIRLRLILLLLGPLALVLLAGYLIDYRTAYTPASDLMDHALEHMLEVLEERVRDTGLNAVRDLDPKSIAFSTADQTFFSVATRNGEVLAGVTGLPLPRKFSKNFYDGEFQGLPVRLTSRQVRLDKRDLVLRVAQTTEYRADLAQRLALATLVPNLLIAACTILIVYLGTGYGLKPLEDLGQAIAQRTSRDLAPFDERETAQEVRPVVKGLNRLLGLVRDSSTLQQRFLENAAHQIRTPIAGLRAQLDMLANEAKHDAAMGPRLRAVREAAHRLAHLVSQLLALARAEPSSNIAAQFHPIDLRTIIEDGASLHLDNALAKQIDLGYELESAVINGSEWLIKELHANLLDNAISYTQSGGRVTVRCGRNGSGVFLEVEDNGPGIPEIERQRVFERFYRIPQTGGVGSGLGLAIAREIAESHDAVVELRGAGEAGGTLIRVIFPPSDATRLELGKSTNV